METPNVTAAFEQVKYQMMHIYICMCMYYTQYMEVWILIEERERASLNEKRSDSKKSKENNLSFQIDCSNAAQHATNTSL